MAQPFTLDDLFAVGIGLDLVGACLLGRGLLVSPTELLSRSRARWNFHAGLAVGQASDRVDALGGLVILGGGFALQALGYVLSLVAAGLAIAVAAIAFVLFERVMRRRLHLRLLVELARYDAAGRRHDLPAARRLQDLGMAFGIGGTVVEVQPGGPALYALRVFGVAAVRDDDVD